MKEDNRKMVRMKATQLPVMSNQATTRHKLQGASINQLFVNNWNYTTNWPYAVLSQLQSSKGLYLCNKLSMDLTKYAMPWQLQKMIQWKKEHQHSGQRRNTKTFLTMASNI